MPNDGGDNLYAGAYLKPKKVSFVEDDLEDFDYRFK
jgi:hypothetical protein